jgi:helix-turn-helix protein
MLTTNEIADRYNVAYSTVILWIKTGKLEGAVKEPNPRGDIWLVPESALQAFDRGRKGRPKKSTEADASATSAKPKAEKRARKSSKKRG